MAMEEEFNVEIETDDNITGSIEFEVYALENSLIDSFTVEQNLTNGEIRYD